jgi:hypothetical protein
MFVVGIGKRTTPPAFVNACDVFVYTENLVASTEQSPLPLQKSKAKVATLIEKPVTEGLEQLFGRAFEALAQDDGWVQLSAMGSKLMQLDPGFDPRTYGFKQLLHLVQQHKEMFEVRKMKAKGESVVYMLRLLDSQ